MPGEATTGNRPQNEAEPDNSVIVAAAQLVLAEKRTSLALMRTGIALVALPLAIFSALIATSRYYSVTDVPHLFIPVVGINITLILLGAYLVFRAARQIHHQDRMIHQIKSTHPVLASYID